ncbi:hypothetical protein A2U01_0031311, partial [Trifolium medium]|nr:hypothetical protein [Trifolium medium]
GSRIQSWRDLANAFVKQYQYNIDMAPDRTQLHNMSQKEGESFRVYAQRWRELAAQSGKIQANMGSQCTSKEPANSFTKKNEEETNVVTPNKRVLDPIPMPYSQLLSYLVHNGMVTPRAPKPMTPPFPAWYDAKAKCEFHLGTKGHSTDNCRTFRYKVQELIDKKLLTFKQGRPNVKDSLLPGHTGSSAKAI